MPKVLNLPPDYFTCPPLSQQETQHYIAKARASACTLVETMRESHGPIRWHEAGSCKRVQVYKGVPRSLSTRLSLDGECTPFHCGITTIHASVDEVAAFFDTATTEKLKAFAATQDDILDGVVLYTLVNPDGLHQVTIKWIAVRMPSGLIKVRDFLMLECQDAFTDKTGRRGWVRSYHSIQLPCCPELQNNMGFVRGSMYHSGYVIMETDTPGVLKCIQSLQINIKGSRALPGPVYDTAVKRRLGVLASLDKKLQARRLGKQPFLNDLELLPKADRMWCQLCANSFNLFVRKTQCRKCGEVVCSACTQSWTVNSPELGTRKVRICTPCTRTVLADVAWSQVSTHHRTNVNIQGSLMNYRQYPEAERLKKPTDKRATDQMDAVATTYSRPSEHLSTFALWDSAVTITEASRQYDQYPRDYSFHRVSRTVRKELMSQDDIESLPIIPSMRSNIAEQGSISFCDSVDGYFHGSRSKTSYRNGSTVSIIDLYQKILALTTQQQALPPYTRASAPAHRRIRDELRVLNEKLDAAMEQFTVSG